MKFVNVRELKNKTSEVLRIAEKEVVIVTSRGKPRAIVKSISEKDFKNHLIKITTKTQDILNNTVKDHKIKGGQKSKTKTNP